MSSKSARIAGLLAPHRGGAWPAHYLAFFDCFNRQLFYEAHEVLEPLWLVSRPGPKGRLYKSLIQLAGVFIHVQKARSGPAAALLVLARANLQFYSGVCDGLRVADVLCLIDSWRVKLAGSLHPSDLLRDGPPHLRLLQEG